MKPFIILLLITIFAGLLTGCNRNHSVPFPEDDTTSQPHTLPVHFSAPQTIRFSDTTPITITTKKLNFNALPEEVYDSSVAKPFAKEPKVVQFSWDSLPDAAFNYDSLPSKSLHFTFSVIEPQIIKVGPLVLKENAGQPIYEIPDLDVLAYLGLNITEDKAGFIWIASDKGLFRYDGQNLTKYKIQEPSIYNPREDDKGQIWFTGWHGIYVFDPRKNLIQYESFQTLDCKWVSSLIQDDKHKMWLATDSGVRIIDINNNLVKSITEKQGLSGNSAKDIIRDKKDNIWIATNKGVTVINKQQNNITYFHKNNGLGSDESAKLLEDDRNRIWISHMDSLDIIDRQKGTITLIDTTNMNIKKTGARDYIYSMANSGNGKMLIFYYQDAENLTYTGLKNVNVKDNTIEPINLGSYNAVVIYSILFDKSGQDWIATGKGLLVFNKSGYSIQHAGKTKITALAEDNHKNIWIASENNGIRILNASSGRAKILNKASGLSTDQMQDVHVIDGNVYAGTNSGLDVIDSSYQTIEHINLPMVTATITRQNTIWVSNYQLKGITVIDPIRKIKYLVDVSPSMDDTLISAFKKDNEGNIWFITGKGKPGEIDKNTFSVKYLDVTSIFKVNFPYNYICFSKDGNTWLGEDTTVCKLNKQKDSVTVFTPAQGLFNSSITSLNEFNNQIYSGTIGINIITPPNSSVNNKWNIQSIGKEYGIRRDVTTANSETFTQDGTYLWAGNEGLTFLKAPLSNGIQPNTYITGIDIFNQPQQFSNRSGNETVTEDTLWTEDKSKYYLKGQTINQASDANQAKMKWDSTTSAYHLPVNLILPYDQNTVQFHFLQADLGAQDNIEYRYMLEGSDKEWSAKTTNTISNAYFSLPDGSYTFKVSSLYNNAWSEPATFRFTIATPWWKTWWAIIIYLVIIGLIYNLFRSLNINRQNKMLEVKVKQRTEQLNRSLEELKSTQAQLIQSEKMASLGELTAGIAHEIQNPLNFVNNFSELNKELLEELKEEIDNGNMNEVKTIANDVIENEVKINHHGKRADAIVKGMLQHSRKKTGKKEPTDINALCDEYLRLSYHGFRAKDKSFNADFKTHFDESIGNINIVPQDMGRVLLNLFNNAFYAINENKKTADENYQPLVTVATKRSLSTRGEGWGEVEIIVKDNGNGFPSNIIDKVFQPFSTTKLTGQGTGLGLSLSYDIIKAHNGKYR